MQWFCCTNKKLQLSARISEMGHNMQIEVESSEVFEEANRFEDFWFREQVNFFRNLKHPCSFFQEFVCLLGY